MLAIRMALCLALLGGAACGGEEGPPRVRTGPVRVDPLCDELRPRIDDAQRIVRKYEKRAGVPISPGGEEFTTEELDRIDEAQREYHRLRQRGVAFGCVGG